MLCFIIDILHLEDYKSAYPKLYILEYFVILLELYIQRVIYQLIKD